MTRNTRREHSSSRFAVALAAFCLSLSAQAGGPPAKAAAPAAARAAADSTDQLIIKYRKDSAAARTFNRSTMAAAHAAANA